jgi:signal transduction histidine kinase/DNA-binding response OmpR family regulator
MSIRARLVVIFSICLSLAYGSIALIVFSSTRISAESAFRSLAISQLEGVEERINTFLEPGAMSVRYLSSLPIVRNSREKLTSYIGATETTKLLYYNHPPYERRVYDEFVRVAQSNNNFVLVFMANDDGQFAQAPEGHIRDAGFDPRTRPWYVEASEDKREITVTSPYVTTEGNAVCSIITKTRDLESKPLGLLGVQYSLQSLTSDLGSRRVLRTGYLVIFDQRGRIIVDGHHPEYIGMEPEQYPELRKRMAGASDETLEGVGARGTQEYIVLREMRTPGWKLAVVFDRSELFESSYELLRNILIASAAIFLLAFGVLSLLARSIVRPIEELTDAASIISSGEYEVSDALRLSLLEKLAVTGPRESKKLAKALRSMIKTLQERIEAAFAASKAKSAFLANMSHEMRTPLNAIIGMTAIATLTSDIERKDYCLKKITDASAHLLGVINDILDMSKIEANKFELSPVNFNFEKMLRKIVGVINFRVDEKHQEFHVRVDHNIPRTLIGDDQRLGQVITNLLSNAVKFTPEYGVISLDARLAGEEDGFLTIQTAVTDTGIGLSGEQQSRLFASFEQADSGTSRKFGGTGLGLAISKRITEMMGGRIWVVSEPGKGSTFAFTVRLGRGKDEAEQQLPSIDVSGLRMLAVDDAPEIQECFREAASRTGILCDVAANGEEACGMIDENGPYDLCFVDWKILGMNGSELTQRINGHDAGRSLVTMISSGEWGELSDGAKHTKADRFLNKPFFASDIIDCLNERFCPDGQPCLIPDDAGADLRGSFAGYCLLLAEDVDVNREIVLALLEPTAIEIVCAKNGAEAVELFKANSEKYDMIFMDVQMPEMDGYEATRRIRALETPRALNVPIVAMTANVFREDVEKCIAAGMNGHVGKPLDLNDVLEKLHRYLPQAREA